jgi:hypothetical protein
MALVDRSGIEPLAHSASPNLPVPMREAHGIDSRRDAFLFTFTRTRGLPLVIWSATTARLACLEAPGVRPEASLLTADAERFACAPVGMGGNGCNALPCERIRL